jgi:hypothetical protein
MFPITIRNKKSGEEKSFSSAQAVANFLAIAPDAKQWTGHEFAGMPKADPEFLRHHAEEQARLKAEAAAASKPAKASKPAPAAKAVAKKAPAKKAKRK